MALNLAKKWEILNEKLIGKKQFLYLTPTHLSYYQVLIPILKKYSRGRLLDAGAGRLILRPFILPYVKKYESMDIVKTHPEIDFIGSVEKMNFKNNSYDTILCAQVLEHILHPWQALDEISRVLRHDGILILSVPHLSYLHGQPHDYFRFTKFALKNLLEERKMKVIKIIPAGGIFSFLLTPFLTLVGALIGYWPITGWLSKAAVFLDKKFDRQKIYALNYIVVAQKKGRKNV